MLMADGSLMDYTNGSYVVSISPHSEPHKLDVSHRIEGAPSLLTAIDIGKAKYACEIRSPFTIRGSVAVSGTPDHTVWVDPNLVSDHRSSMVAGVVALEPITINPDELHPMLRPDAGTVELPVGMWAAMSSPQTLRPIIGSLVTFVRNERLPPGQIETEETETADDPHFTVHCADDVHRAIRERTTAGRHLRVAALIGVCAHFPESEMRAGGIHEDHVITRSLIQRLNEGCGADFHGERADYNAARAATVLEPFAFDIDTDPEDDDD